MNQARLVTRRRVAPFLIGLVCLLLTLDAYDASARTRSSRSGRSRRSSHAARISRAERAERKAQGEKEERAPRPRRGGAVGTLDAWAANVAHAESAMGESWSVFIQDLTTSETIFQYQPIRRLVPASNRKLITFALALDTLGPDYHFTTEFGMTNPPAAGAPLYRGDLVLRSGGDPSMTDPFMKGDENPATLFQSWAASLIGAGVNAVEGNLIVDASAFGADQNQYPEVWSPKHRNNSYASVPSALTMCQNLLKVSVWPGASGGPGRIRIFPSDDGLSIVNHTRTSSRGGGVSVTFGEDDENTLVISGCPRSRGGEEVALVPIPHPLNYIGALLRQKILEAGVRQTGQLVIRTDPAGPPTLLRHPIGVHQSPPLAQMMLLMMQKSNNFLAEQLWRASAVRAKGHGDLNASRQYEQEWYNRHALSWIEPGWDGSGLSRKNEIASSELVMILKAMFATAHRNTMLSILPTSGRNGTMRHHTTSVIEGRVTAKTGTLNGVCALSGFIRDRNGQPRFVFSAIGNARGGTNGRLSKRINDLLSIVTNQLDDDIAAGRRPAEIPGFPTFKDAPILRGPVDSFFDDPAEGETLVEGGRALTN